MNMLHTFSRGLVVTAIVLVVNVGAVDLTTIKGTVRNAPYGQFVLV